MGNVINTTERVRPIRLLLVVLMMSVGLNLLLGCGKNKGQVVGGPAEQCDPDKEDCVDDGQGSKNNLWKAFYGETPMGSYYGPQVILGMDVLVKKVSSSSVESQSISVTPVGDLTADGSLWIEQDMYGTGSGGRWEQRCGVHWGFIYTCNWIWVDGTECLVAKKGKYDLVSGSTLSASGGYLSGDLKLKSDLSMKLDPMLMIASGQSVEDPDGYDYNNYLYGSFTVQNKDGCRAQGAITTPPGVF